MSAVANVLEAAATALLIPGVWIQGNMARDDTGVALRPKDPRACRFCAVGAIEAASIDTNAFEAVREMERSIKRVPGLSSSNPSRYVVKWNDARGRTAEQVARKMLDTAERLRREQGS